MNYTHNHKEEEGSDVAAAPEVFAHPVTPRIPERSSVDRNGSAFKVRCNWTDRYQRHHTRFCCKSKDLHQYSREMSTEGKNSNTSKLDKLLINHERDSSKHSVSPGLSQYHSLTDVLYCLHLWPTASILSKTNEQTAKSDPGSVVLPRDHKDWGHSFLNIRQWKCKLISSGTFHCWNACRTQTAWQKGLKYTKQNNA